MSIDLKSMPLILLLVEDHEPNVAIATIMLDGLGYKFHLAKNGKEAVALFKTGLYSLILMDIEMPIMSGIEATKIIRTHELEINKPAIPIIAVTANNTDDDRQQCAACGMNGFIAKPYLLDDLAATIAEHLPPRSNITLLS